MMSVGYDENCAYPSTFALEYMRKFSRRLSESSSSDEDESRTDKCSYPQFQGASKKANENRAFPNEFPPEFFDQFVVNLSESSSSEDEESSTDKCSNYPDFKRANKKTEKNHPSPSAMTHLSTNKKRRRDPDAETSCKIPAKKPLVKRNLNDDEKAKKIMEKMGYKRGIGLGKHGQGRLSPVKAAEHKGRRGLGLSNKKLKEALLTWNPNQEVVCAQADINWLFNTLEPLHIQDLSNWIRLGPAKMTIDDECLFCDPSILQQVVNTKALFDGLNKNELRRARTRSNPYETIGQAFFLNRAAVKMADIDRACNFMFTRPKIQKPGELLYFADVCAGPGGFSEYVLWRRKWWAKGFGFTLKASNDFKLDDFYAGSPESFHPFYGPKGDGDVCNPENQEAFRDLIMQQTNGTGVHNMMSDGGFSVEGKENIQEILSKRLYLCQCLVALMVVRQGGNFVTKMFDLFTPFSAGLVYLMYRCFESVSIFKPKTSRPANSERYLICRGKRDNVLGVIEYLSRVNRILGENKEHYDVTELVHYSVLKSDVEFFQYFKNSNDEIGTNQVGGLLKIAAFSENSSLLEHRQSEMRKKCLEHWGLPDQMRTIPTDAKPEERLRSIFKNTSLRFLASKSTELTMSNVQSTFLNNPYDWYCMPCGSGSGTDSDNDATFYIGMGRTKTYRYNKGSWVRVNNLELPPDTLVYAEMISELRGEHRSQRKTMALHIIDAYSLGSEDVSQKSLQERHALTKLFCEALWKPTNSKCVRVRAKTLFYLPNNLDEKLSLKTRITKKGTKAEVYEPESSPSDYDNDGDLPSYYIPNSLIFFKGTAKNWSRHLSRSSGFTYYFNCKNNATLYDRDRPTTADAALPESMENRIVWKRGADPALTIKTICSLIRKKCSS